MAAWLLPYRLNVYWISVADTALLFALLAIGMGLVMGIAGQVNLAQIAFFGVGAYVTAILTTHAGYGFWAAALLAPGGRGGGGLVVGTPALRIQSHYLGIVTLGLAVAFLDWITNAPVTGGDSGISGIPTPPLPGVDLSSQYLYYYLELLVLALGLASGCSWCARRWGGGCGRCGTTRWRPAPRAPRSRLLRMIAFVLASVYGGAAGVLYAGLIHYIAPETFSIADMFLLLAMVIIGGRQSLAGCVTGAIALTVGPAGADQPGGVRAARLRAGRRPGRGVRADRAGRDPGPGGGLGRRRRRGRPAARWSRSGRFRWLARWRRGASSWKCPPWPSGSGASRGGRRLVRRPRRRDPRHRRAERVGQDHAVQRDQRALPAVRRADRA